jgi:hypothetical protein
MPKPLGGAKESCAECSANKFGLLDQMRRQGTTQFSLDPNNTYYEEVNESRYTGYHITSLVVTY